MKIVLIMTITIAITGLAGCGGLPRNCNSAVTTTTTTEETRPDGTVVGSKVTKETVVTGTGAGCGGYEGYGSYGSTSISIGGSRCKPGWGCVP